MATEANRRGHGAIDRHIGARLRALRDARGMAQAELGRAIGSGEMQIGKYERGADRIDAARLFEIARALDVPVVTFFDGIA